MSTPYSDQEQLRRQGPCDPAGITGGSIGECKTAILAQVVQFYFGAEGGCKQPVEQLPEWEGTSAGAFSNGAGPFGSKPTPEKDDRQDEKYLPDRILVGACSSPFKLPRQ